MFKFNSNFRDVILCFTGSTYLCTKFSWFLLNLETRQPNSIKHRTFKISLPVHKQPRERRRRRVPGSVTAAWRPEMDRMTGSYLRSCLPAGHVATSPHPGTLRTMPHILVTFWNRSVTQNRLSPGIGNVYLNTRFLIFQNMLRQNKLRR